MAFAKKHADPESKVGFVAVNLNTYESDRLPKMIERATERGFNFTYVDDQRQKLGVELGTVFSPEFFVLDKSRKIVYMGRWTTTTTRRP